MSTLSHDTTGMNVIFVHSSVDDYPLTPYEFRVYGKIARRAGQGIGWPSVEQVAEECLMSEDTARQALQNLTTFGLLNRQERPGLGPHYRLTQPNNWLSKEAVLAIHAEQTEKSRAKRQQRKAKKTQAAPETETASQEASTPPNISDPSEKQGGVNLLPLGKTGRGTPGENREGYPSGKQGGVSRSIEVDPFEGDPETEGTRLEARLSAAVPAQGQKQGSNTGAADAAWGNPPNTPPVQDLVQPMANGRASHATGNQEVPPAAAAVENPVDNYSATPVGRRLLGYFGVGFLTQLLEEDDTRRDWFQLDLETLQACKDDAVQETKGKRWKGTLIGLLEAATAELRRTRRVSSTTHTSSSSVSIGDEIKARIAATRSNP